MHRFGEAADSGLLEAVVHALVSKGDVLFQLNLWENALAAWNEVERRFKERGCENSALLDRVAQTLVNRAALFGELNRPHDALVACEDVVLQFGDSPSVNCLKQVALAMVNKGIALCEIGRPRDALAAWNEMIVRFGNSESPALRNLVEDAFLEKADTELGCGYYDSAAETAGVVLDGRRTESLEKQGRGHLIKAKALLLGSEPPNCEFDLQAAFELLPKIDIIPRTCVDVLMIFCIKLGPRRMLALIQASSSSALLLPLTTALELELGLNPRVAREVAEVAQDIRRDLAELRKREPTASGVASASWSGRTSIRNRGGDRQ